jgi:hypothetical protein
MAQTAPTPVRPANAARAVAAAASIVHLILHPDTREDVRTMIIHWVSGWVDD